MKHIFGLGPLVSLTLGIAICAKVQPALATNTVEYLRKACHEEVVADDSGDYRNREYFSGFCFGAMRAVLMIYFVDIIQRGKAKDCRHIAHQRPVGARTS